MSDDHFLSRWSRRKHAVKRGEPVKDPEPPPAMPAAVAASNVAEAPAETPPELPPVESLTPESDFTPFMRSEVDPKTRQQALRTLFRDERFNVMDGLDVYIDDYSKFEVLDPEIVKQLVQSRYIFAPPPTRVNAEGTRRSLCQWHTPLAQRVTLLLVLYPSCSWL